MMNGPRIEPRPPQAMIQPIDEFTDLQLGQMQNEHQGPHAPDGVLRNIITESLIRVAGFIRVLERLTFLTTPYRVSDPAKPPWCPRNCTRRKGCQ